MPAERRGKNAQIIIYSVSINKTRTLGRTRYTHVRAHITVEGSLIPKRFGEGGSTYGVSAVSWLRRISHFFLYTHTSGQTATETSFKRKGEAKYL